MSRVLFVNKTKSLMQLNVIFNVNDELENNSNQQDPLYWPLNPDSYGELEGCLDH
jgi:hypothetical protein